MKINLILLGLTGALFIGNAHAIDYTVSAAAACDPSHIRSADLGKFTKSGGGWYVYAGTAQHTAKCTTYNFGLSKHDAIIRVKDSHPTANLTCIRRIGNMNNVQSRLDSVSTSGSSSSVQVLNFPEASFTGSTLGYTVNYYCTFPAVSTSSNGMSIESLHIKNY